MKTYKVKVNGKLYEVQLEEVSESTATISAPASQPAPAKAVASNGSNAVEAPIAGKILSVKVNVGDTVAKGQTVVVLEAMKMENNINADRDGKVTDIRVAKGDTVADGAVLVVLG